MTGEEEPRCRSACMAPVRKWPTPFPPLADVFRIVSIRGPYLDRGISTLVRMYIETRPKEDQ